MSYDAKCLAVGRELIDIATQIRARNMDQKVADAIITEITGNAIKREWKAKNIAEAASEYIIHGYLTAPTNLATNIFSALSQTLVAPITRDMSILLSKITGTEDPRRLGEGLAMMKSAFKNLGERMDFAKEGYISGKPLDMKISTEKFYVSEKQFNDFVEKLGLSETEKLFAKNELYDIYAGGAIPGPFGKALAQGAKAGVGIDEFNKAMFRRMQYDALAYRMAPIVAKKDKISEEEALKKIGLDNLSPSDYQAKIREGLSKMGFDSPQAEMLKLERTAKQLVFQGEAGKWLGGLSRWRAEHPLIGSLIVPFIKTPTLILNEGVAFVPGIGMLHRKAKVDTKVGQIDPKTGKKFIDPKTGQEYVATGKFEGTDFAVNIKQERPDLLAKQMLGVAATAYINHLVQQGVLTGTSPSGDKPKLSVKVGDTWYGYGRIEPLATVIGLAVDMHDLVDKYKKDPEAKQEVMKDVEKYGGLYLKAIGDNITQKSFMEGFAKMFAAAVEPERNATSFLQSYATALVPAGVAAVARTIDPIEREVTTFLDKVKSRVPGAREALPVKYDITGEPVQRSLGEVWAGVKTKTPNEIQTALESSGYVFTPSDKKIHGVDLSTEQLSEYRKLAGTYFSAMVRNMEKHPQFIQVDASMKDFYLKGAMTKARTAASNQLTFTLFNTDEKFRQEYILELRKKKGQADQLLREQGRLQ
jgi:hypothetical protein